jgi:hypothetical protein
LHSCTDFYAMCQCDDGAPTEGRPYKFGKATHLLIYEDAPARQKKFNPGSNIAETPTTSSIEIQSLNDSQ